MVQGDAELCIDELILQIFEEHEETFCFPIRSQKDARVFVKALHNKGLPFESICGEIDEFEYNFSAWRKGLGRLGIGKRVLERINRPLQELLDEDEDELYAQTSSKSSLKFKVNGSKQNAHSNDNERLAQARLAAAERKEENSPVHMRSHSRDEKSVTNGMLQSLNSKVEEKSQHLDNSFTKDPNNDFEDGSEGERKRTSSGHDSVSEEDMSEKESSTEPETEDSTERADSGVASDKEDVRDRIAMFEAKRGRKAEQERQREVQKEKDEREKKEREDREREEREFEEKLRMDRMKEKQKREQEEEERRQMELELKEKEREEREKLFREERDRKEKEEREEIEREERERKRQEERERLQQEQEEINRKEREERLKKDKEESDMKEKEEKQGLLARVQNGGLQERKGSIERLGSLERKGSFKEAFSLDDKYDTAAIDSVDENYNSDLDPENEDQSPVMAKLVQKISAMRSSSKNGAGFVYAFSDGKTENNKTRIKVGTSRCPKKRLRQSQVFNPDMFQVTTVPVSQRISVMKEINEELHEFAIEELKNWFEGDVDEIADVVSAVAAKYPSKSIQQNSGSSEC